MSSKNINNYDFIQAANQITTLEDLGELKNLAAMHLRDNKLDKLDGFSDKMTSLQYLNLR